MTDNEYTYADKAFIMGDNLQVGIYIKAVPIDLNKRTPTRYGFLISYNNDRNLYSRYTINLKIIHNGRKKIITIYPIKFDIYYKKGDAIIDSKRSFFNALLESLEKQTDK